MSGLGPLLRLVAIGVFTALAVHIVAILSAPSLAENDAYAAIARTGAELALVEIGRDSPSGLVDPFDDPATVLAACRFDLTQGPVRIRARPGEGFFSVSLSRRGGGVYYAVTDRAALRGLIEIVVGTPTQLADLAAEDPEDAPITEIRVAAPSSQGFAAFRALARWPSRREDARVSVFASRCDPA